ncbi:MAG: hypothetical protein AAFZ07_23240 [Actinomycetota bacterium]
MTTAIRDATADDPTAKGGGGRDAEVGGGGGAVPAPEAPVSEAELRQTEKVSIRISRRLLLAARQSAAPLEAGTVQEICSRLLESALRRREPEGRERALALVDRTLADLGEPLADVAPVTSKDLKGISVLLSPYAIEIAQNLAIRKGSHLTLQKVCEPLLSAELMQHRTEAIETAREVIKKLEELDE